MFGARPTLRRRSWAVGGGVLWIVLFACLLAGVVAVNVAVLRLNLELDRESRERTELRADIAQLRSEISSAAATDASRASRRERARPRRGRVGGDDLHPARPVKAAATNRRIVFLAGVFVALLAAALLRAVWLQAVKGPEYAAMAIAAAS